MREIKFRAWDSQWKEMRYGVGVWYSDYTGPVAVTYEAGYEYNEWIEHDSWILTQYTGLKDKNGKEIYEGDVYQEQHMSPVVIKFGDYSVDYYTEVIAGFYCEVIGDRTSTWCVQDGGEVIGNIYENPELLDG